MRGLIGYAKLILVTSCVVSFSSCKKIDCTEIYTPAPYAIDADGDGIDDFIVGYGALINDVPGMPSCSWSGNIIRLDSNNILRRDKYPKVFLQPNDTVRFDYSNNPDYEWRTACAFMGWNNHEDPYGKVKWQSRSLHPSNHYMGIKINSGGDIKIGWLKFHLNYDNGNIILVGAKVTDEDWIVVE